jgi:predicted metal-dependent HD superfamily phosphohydrolase
MQNKNYIFLQNIWTEIATSLSLEAALKNDFEAIFQDLMTRYDERHRAYHNLNHLVDIFNSLKNITFLDKNSVYFAIFFHDAIYQPLKQDNEAQSANLALCTLKKFSFYLKNNELEKIKTYILATQKHELHEPEPDLAYFLDADLKILGSEENAYQLYTQAIRKEYQIVPDFLYKRGRKKALNHFLTQEKIYKTAFFYERYEVQARKNIENELLKL